MNSSLEIAKKTLWIESQALLALMSSLDHHFQAAIDLLFQTKGRVIISGMGKSGHMGRKIAATFSSTGRPSFFMHAAEAGHGDLGMVTPDDCLLLLSYTGETKELEPILTYAHRFGIPIISITGKSDSTLAKFSQISLILPQEPEACPLGLAPTTSTTMTLALGDALAVALLQKKGFTSQEFHNFHPKGSLGQQLKRIKMIMNKDLPLVSPQTNMQDVILVMSEKRVGCVGVTDQQLIGMITDGDLRRHMSPNLLEKTAQDIMTKNPITIFEDDIVADILHLMNTREITNIFVTDKEKNPIGIVHIHDCLHKVW